MSEDKPTESERLEQTKHRLIWLAKAAGAGLAVLVVFQFGVAVGSGKVVFGSAAASQQSTLPSRLDYSTAQEVYTALKENYDGKLTESQLLDGVKGGLAEATGDPYTEYFNPKDAKKFQEELQGSFTGIGAELGKDSSGNLIIVSPIDGFPAQKAGLRPQDVIVSIDGKSTSGMGVDEAVSKIRGPKDTKVTLKVVRSKSEDLSFTIARADIQVPSVKSEILEGNIGYLQITQFSDNTTGLVQKAAQEFKDKEVKGVVLDMRNNPGGLLPSAVDVSSLWLPEGKLVLQEKRGSKVVQTHTASGNSLFQGMPTVVLINEGSASAAEIVAGALHDNKAATLIGVKSFGKGSVQQVRPLSGGAELKVTVARWYRPNGQNIDKKGISPDKEIKMTSEDYKSNRDPQKDAALQQFQ